MLRNWSGAVVPGMGPAVAALMTVGLLISPLSAASADASLTVYLDMKRDSDAVEAARSQLLSLDTGVLTVALVKQYRSSAIDTRQRLRIIALLGAMRNTEGAAVLQKICSVAVLTSLDVRDWGGLAKAVAQGEDRDDSDAAGRIWKRMTADQCAAVRQVAANADAGGAPVDVDRLALLSGLNRVMGEETFYTKSVFTRLHLPAEARALVDRWRIRQEADDRPEDLFTAQESRQLNEFILRALFKGSLQDKYAIAAHQYETRLADAAVKELSAQAGQPAAAAALLSLDPAPHQARAYMDAVKNIRGQPAAERLFRYLLTAETAASNRARDLLKERLDGEADIVVALALNTINRYAFQDENLKSLPAIANRNLMTVAMAVPDENNRQDILERALKSEDKLLREAAFKALVHQPKMIKHDAIREAVSKRLEADASAASVLEVLRVLQLSGDRGSLPLVAAQLEHQSKEVRVSASRAMGLLTGKPLGANPAVWKKWWSDQQAAGATLQTDD